jgi:ketosteroid isomerase-like protein
MTRYAVHLLTALMMGPMCALAGDGPNEIELAFTEAFNANDLRALVALYAPSAVLYPPDTFALEGIAKIRESYAQLMNEYTIRDFTITKAHHQTRGDISSGWGEFKVTMIPKAGGETLTMTGRFMDVSQRINGKWLYLADHASIPMSPPTRKKGAD